MPESLGQQSPETSLTGSAKLKVALGGSALGETGDVVIETVPGVSSDTYRSPATVVAEINAQLAKRKPGLPPPSVNAGDMIGRL